MSNRTAPPLAAAWKPWHGRACSATKPARAPSAAAAVMARTAEFAAAAIARSHLARSNLDCGHSIGTGRAEGGRIAPASGACPFFRARAWGAERSSAPGHEGFRDLVALVEPP